MAGKALESFKAGTEVEGKVVLLEQWGAFVDIGSTRQALLHRSELPDEDAGVNVKDKFLLGETVKAWIKEIDLEKQQVALTRFEPGKTDDKKDADDDKNGDDDDSKDEDDDAGLSFLR
mmetsp:Transcript_47532/g.83569  ORF Transcript_47532/g.83569 Transcript_47532/m.83569 type:complete len:118 (+) Transcript_47532:3-356(+)